jgi:hypothetical protein
MALALGGIPAAGGDRVQRHSGRVESVELGEGRVVVDELGARGRRLRHEFHVNPDTPILTAVRLRPWEMRGTGAFNEIAVSLADLLTGDFVVVESTEEGGRPVAVRITIVEGARRSPP